MQVCTVAASIAKETARSNKTWRASNVWAITTMKITNTLQLAESVHITWGHFNYLRWRHKQICKQKTETHSVLSFFKIMPLNVDQFVER